MRGGRGGRGGGGRASSSFGGGRASSSFREARQHSPYNMAATSASTAGRRVYVGNLSYDVAWQDLKDHFKQCGNVVRADLLEEAGGRSKGCGLVEFATAEDAQNAIATLNDSDLKGRTIFVREDREEDSVATAGASAAGRRLYVGNLSYDVAWYDLKDHFKQCGNVVRADVMEEAGGRSKGCGLVEFATTEEAQLAVTTLNDSDLKGRTIFVREDRETNAAAASISAAGRRLYVGNLSYDVAWYDLKDHFKQCGNVVRADVMEEAGGRSKGCGLVEFATTEEAQLAVTTLNDSDLKGRTIFVREDREPTPSLGNNHGRGGSTNTVAGSVSLGVRVYVGNLPWDVTWPQLKDHFKSAGTVAHADVPVGEDGRSKGYGVVEFKTPKDALFAIHSLQGTMLGGRPIKLREYGEA